MPALNTLSILRPLLFCALTLIATNLPGIAISRKESPKSCNCDLTIIKNGTYSNKDTSVQPGQTVCIQAGTYTNLYFNNFIGTNEKPIHFINCGGQVIISSENSPSGLQFYGCRNFTVSGTGSDQYNYGILIAKTAPNFQALRVENKSSDCEIDHIEIAGAGFAGIMVKTDPTCDSTTWRGNLTVKNINIHHNYIHDTNSEGLYIGSTSWNEGYVLKCDGVSRKVLPHNIYGLQIHHNITERTGTEGIQYAAAPDAEVHHNTVKSSGLSPFAAFQNNGMQIGGGVSGRFYNNQIYNAPATGIIIIGNLGNTKVFNNLVVNSGTNGIFCDDRPGSIPNTPMYFLNNTIISSGEDAIKLYNEINNNIISNNIIAGVGKNRKYLTYLEGVKTKMESNFLSLSVDSVGFINPLLNDFRLSSTSNLIDKGTEQFATDVPFDLDGNHRPIGYQIDIGAYEYHPYTNHSLIIYPVPCENQVSLWSDQVMKQISVYDLLGVEIMRIDSTPVNDYNLSLSSLSAGIYILRAETDTGYISQRFLKR